MTKANTGKGPYSGYIHVVRNGRHDLVGHGLDGWFGCKGVEVSRWTEAQDVLQIRAVDSGNKPCDVAVVRLDRLAAVNLARTILNLYKNAATENPTVRLVVAGDAVPAVVGLEAPEYVDVVMRAADLPPESAITLKPVNFSNIP